MKQYELYAVTAVLLFCLGLYGVIYCRHFLRKIMGINIMGVGVFLLLVSLARRDEVEFADPVPHAMVLTGIVIAVSASAFGMALASRIYQETGLRRMDVEEAEEAEEEAEEKSRGYELGRNREREEERER